MHPAGTKAAIVYEIIISRPALLERAAGVADVLALCNFK
jgi:hypothetical protein